MFNFANIKNTFFTAKAQPLTFAKNFVVHTAYEIAKSAATTAAKVAIQLVKSAHDLAGDVAGVIKNAFYPADAQEAEVNANVMANAPEVDANQEAEANPTFATEAKEFVLTAWEAKDDTYFGQVAANSKPFYTAKALLDLVATAEVLTRTGAEGALNVITSKPFIVAAEAAYKTSIKPVQFDEDNVEDDLVKISLKPAERAAEQLLALEDQPAELLAIEDQSQVLLALEDHSEQLLAIEYHPEMELAGEAAAAAA